MNANVKRLLSVVVALVLIVSCVPAAAFATNTPDLPSATVTEIENENLTYTLNFKADQITDEQLAYYGNWYADFVLTVNKTVTFDANGGGDGYLSGHYDKWSRSWVDVPGTAVTVAANEPLKIMQFASELMGKQGLKYTYAEIYNDVKDFDCGVYFNPEFLGANTDLEVSLTLCLYNPENESEMYVIGEKYVFTNPVVVKNNRTGVAYEDISDAVWDADAGDKLIMLKDISVTALSVYEDITLDLKGHSIEAKYANIYGDIVDSSADNSGRLVTAPSRVMFANDNRQMPVYTGDSYCFVEMKGFHTGMQGENKFVFQPLFETYAHQFLLNGASAAEVSVRVEMSWIREGNVRTQTVIYSDDMIRNFINSARPNGGYNSIFTLTIANMAAFEDLKFTAQVYASSDVLVTPDTIVEKEDPEVVIPSVSATYGETLADITLPEGFTWKDSSVSVGNAGTNTFVAVYTPEDTDQYNVIEVVISVKVAQAEPEVTAPESLDAVYGDSLADIVLPEGFTWKDADASAGNAGSNTFIAVYTPADPNYKPVEIEIVIDVAKAEPEVEIPANVEGVYGNTLADIVLPEGFTWKDSSLSAGDAGNNTFIAIYTPADDNYLSIEVEIPIAVAKAEPIVEVPTGLTAVYGDQLSKVALPSGFTWKDASQSVGNAGNNTFVAVYTPENLNFLTVEVEIEIAVSKADPDVSAPANLIANYGDTLADVALPNGFAWKDASQSVGNAGDNMFVAVYTPDDTANYNVVELAVKVTVGKINPTVEIPTGLVATYGDTLADVALPSGFAWKNPASAVGNAGSNLFVAIYTPADPNYNTLEVEVPVVVNKANPVVTIPTGLTANLGDTLADVALPNGFAWKDATESINAIGVSEHTAIYTPADTGNYNVVEVILSVTASKLDVFSVKLENADTFLYRVGNENQFNVKYLFDAADTENLGNITVTAESVSAARAVRSGNVIASATGSSFNDLKLGFDSTYTGPVLLTIASENANPVTLFVEVVNGKNIVSVEGSINGSDLVFLNNMKVNSNGTVNYHGVTVYGNGFTLDVTNGMRDYNSKQGHGIVIAKQATIDNLRIEGAVFENYGAYTNQSDYSAAVDATGCVIQNCYISNCSAPIRSNGNTIINTTLYGGTVANLILSGGNNVLTDVTTINYNDGRGVLGFGIVISDSASDNTKLEINGTLTQHNYVYPGDISQVNNEYAKAMFNSMFDNAFAGYHIGSDTYVNTGIVFLTENLNTDIITDNANTGYLRTDNASITIKSTLGNVTVNGAIYSVPSTGTVDNNYVASAPVQGAYDLKLNFNLGDQAISYEGATDGNFLYYEGGVVYGAYTTGQAPITIDLNQLASSCSVEKYGKALSLSAKCLDVNGNALTAQNGVVTLSEKGIYTFVFTAVDDLIYNASGELTGETLERIYYVSVDMTIKDAAVADATMTISSSALTGDYISSGTNKKYKFYPLKAITSIMDDANKDGVLESFNFKSNISSATITSTSDNAFANGATITVTYNGGQVLTITIGTPSNLNSPGASNGGKALTVQKDNSNGIYVQSAGAVASSSAATGTWPITGWSFKGTSGTVITNNTKVTVNFTKPSSGCVTGDTLITLADGSLKRADQISADDLLLSWDFETGTYAAAPAGVLECHGTQEWTVVQLNFSNGTSVKIVDDHGFFDTAVNDFVFISEKNANDFIGHSFVCADGDSYGVVTLDSVDVYTEVNSIWTIQVAVYNNAIANGMFTLNTPDFEGWLDYFDITDEMIYDQAHKQAEIEKYGLADYEQFAHLVTYEQFVAFNGQYLNILMGRGVLNMADLELLISMYLK